MKTIELQNISIGFHFHKKKETIICQNININAFGGELIAVIGKNGIGKSTLLKTIARLQPVLKGHIEITGVDQSKIKFDSYASLVSYVSTDIIKIPNFSVYHLVALGRFPYTNWLGSLAEYDKAIIHDSINLVGLKNILNRNINELSDGERQRAMVARALAQDTPIIILDEPTAYLDLNNKHEIVHLLGKLTSEKGKTIIFSSHDLNIAISEVDKIWLMGENEIIQGAPEDLILQNVFSTMFDGNLDFEWQSGSFKSRKKNLKHIQLHSDDDFYSQVTTKALDRIGFSLNKNAIPIIKVESNQWTLKLSNQTIDFQSIYDLCFYLKNNTL